MFAPRAPRDRRADSGRSMQHADSWTDGRVCRATFSKPAPWRAKAGSASPMLPRLPSRLRWLKAWACERCSSFPSRFAPLAFIVPRVFLLPFSRTPPDTVASSPDSKPLHFATGPGRLQNVPKHLREVAVTDATGCFGDAIKSFRLLLLERHHVYDPFTAYRRCG